MSGKVKVRVVTLDESRFAEACSTLARRIEAQMQPDLVVGIKRGGDTVARTMLAQGYFPRSKYISISCQRLTTSFKRNSGLKHLLSRLPTSVLDVLRNIEGQLREALFVFGGRRRTRRQVSFVEAELAGIQNVRTVAVIDDAVDSGESLVTVVERIKGNFPDAEYVTAAITRTFRHPMVEPTISLYSHVLVRMPWAEDC